MTKEIKDSKKLNCFITISEEEAFDSAKKTDARISENKKIGLSKLIKHNPSEIINNLLDKNFVNAENNIKSLLYKKMAAAVNDKYPSSQDQEVETPTEE